MEKKLQQYRSRKKKEEFFENCKAKLRKMLSFASKDDKKPEDTEYVININEAQQESNSPVNSPNKSEQKTHLKNEIKFKVDHESIESGSDAEEEQIIVDTSKKKTWLDYVTYTVYFLFWATLYAIAIQLKFGIVYFMFSVLFGIYFNTRTGPKKKGEVSAYSVFNPNLESIDGTLKAEQFEKEMGLRLK